MKKILIVDDLKVFRMLLKASLANLKDVVFVEAENGIDALEKIKNHSITLIILDYNMPHMNGGEFLRAFKMQQQFKNVPVIMLTAERNAQKITNSLATAYMTKPFEREKLTEVVASMVYGDDDITSQVFR